MTAIAKPETMRPDVARAAPRAMTGREKAAIIVRLLLTEGGGLPLKALPDDLQTALTEQMGAMRSVDRATLRAVVEEFVSRLDSVGLSFPGGLERALDLLESHISPTAATRIRSQRASNANADPWERIAAFGTDRLLAVLNEESTEIGAVLLSKLAVAQAAELLGKLPGDRARRLAYGVGKTGHVQPETVRQIGLSLVGQLSAAPARAFGGVPEERVGAILNIAPALTRDEVLAGLSEDDAEFADRVRRAIFTFADIARRIEGRDVPKITRKVDQAQLVTALAAATGGDDAASAEFVLASLSQRMAATLREEMAARGAVKVKDADAAQTAIIAAIRELQEAGELALKTEEEAEA
ncbi:MAG TPA: FliG C-terminal domain-containing protein [Albidovulum sp.]|uniref:flagellar motor switch protein FliG n=1 Tax=Albidovulum sp. TaxID=1872424 RepID=UPI002C24FE6D|nr:FliG C-terminal domain-containing protein [Albidovulum sp.]